VPLEGGDLFPEDPVGSRAVDRMAGERQPETARDPLCPGLESDSPLELSAAVGDRVAEGEHAQAAVDSWFGRQADERNAEPARGEYLPP
jgi:hypothetical protein